MKKFLLTLFISISFLLIISPTAYSQSYYPVNFSLWYPLSINQTEQDTSFVNVSLLFTKVGVVNGLSLNLGGTVIKNDMSGLQMNLGYTYVGGEFSGVNITGLVNVNDSTLRGIEFAGLVNLVFGDVYGGQAAFAYNFTLGEFWGVQFAGFFNVIGEKGVGLQIGNANMAGASFTGWQFATVFNFVGDEMKGVQTSFINISEIVKGVQLGLGNLTIISKGVQAGFINYAETQKGLQIGLINIAQEQKGVPVGVVNVATKNGDIEWINYVSNFSFFNTGVKLMANNFFTTFDIGINHIDSDTSSATLGFHYGYDFLIGDKIKLSPDIGDAMIFDEKLQNQDSEMKYHAASQIRLIGQFEISSIFRFFAGIGYSNRSEVYDETTINEGKFIYLLGVSLF